MLQVNLEAVRSLVLKGIAEMPYPDLDSPLRRAERLALPEEIKTTIEDEVRFILNDTHYKIADGHDFTKPAPLPKSLPPQEIPAAEAPIPDPEEEAEALSARQEITFTILRHPRFDDIIPLTMKRLWSYENPLHLLGRHFLPHGILAAVQPA